MSVQTLYTAATGMQSLETKLDVISNNLANVNTVAYKKDRANFEDLFYRNRVLPGVLDSNNQPTPVGTHIGLGVKVSGTQIDYNQGAFQQTNKELDVAIEGKGFFQVQDPSSGQIMYTRAGNFSINANNQLVVGSASTGLSVLEPAISIPTDTVGVVIAADGRVMIQQAGQSQMQQAGQLQLATFVNPEGLLKKGENLYAQTDASNAPVVGTPGNKASDNSAQNALEASNVEPVQELIDLITTQRSFELNSQCIQAGDQILQLISNLRR